MKEYLASNPKAAAGTDLENTTLVTKLGCGGKTHGNALRLAKLH